MVGFIFWIIVTAMMLGNVGELLAGNGISVGKAVLSEAWSWAQGNIMRSCSARGCGLSPSTSLICLCCQPT